MKQSRISNFILIIICSSLPVSSIFFGLSNLEHEYGIALDATLVILGSVITATILYQSIKDPDYFYSITKSLIELDIDSFTVIKKYPIIGLIFLLTFSSITVFLFSTLSVNIFTNNRLSATLLTVFVYSFISFSIYAFGFILIGDYLQRVHSQSKRFFILDIFWSFIHTIPYILLLTLAWLILVLTKVESEQKKYTIEELLKDFTFGALFLVLKRFVFINLAIISFEDAPAWKSHKVSSKHLKENNLSHFKIKMKSGALFVALSLLIFSFSAFYNEQISPLTKGHMAVLIKIFFILGNTILFLEQISVLNFIIRSRHPKLSH